MMEKVGETSWFPIFEERRIKMMVKRFVERWIPRGKYLGR
jgi:hypothetical protein